ncbi:MAG: DUF2283 domain-containing protein [Spirochaetaceae bacterium]|nr:MAG: DUF2283 domain-containing protein [Spirochaetaceae bacterium]
MKVHIDREADALSLRLSDAPVDESDEVAPGIILNYDIDDTVVGIEVLDVSLRSRRTSSSLSAVPPEPIE